MSKSEFEFVNKQKGWLINASIEDQAIYILNSGGFGLDLPWDYFGKPVKKEVKNAVAAHLSDESLATMELDSSSLILCQRARSLCL